MMLQKLDPRVCHSPQSIPYRLRAMDRVAVFRNGVYEVCEVINPDQKNYRQDCFILKGKKEKSRLFQYDAVSIHKLIPTPVCTPSQAQAKACDRAIDGNQHRYVIVCDSWAEAAPDLGIGVVMQVAD